MNAIFCIPMPDVKPEVILDRIKSALGYHQQHDRFDDIVTAHAKTFDWALQVKERPTQGWPSLHNWLCHGQAIYSVSGKAGSGKSTLMKYLHQDVRLHDALQSWAGNAQLLTLSFYFWNAGSESQKSQKSLFRSLLYQALCQKPSLGPIFFPERYLPSAKWTEFPTFHDVRRAFKHFTASLDDDSLKVALLIDGLDEFDAV
ncbi:hypothetical protein CC86DRAFT_403564 [Ophiobolus disseminans]|uniref:Nephrocystin 3-like N-terminal domain-containing protein n=1 Tax=Ophiobolus disseminans TaxID=1469910 RepID=A0A6A7ABM4_9PLEO|nr:hypothetical protein CC86DRAFT_403564 [Ophiobolus disseminans]